MQFETAETLTLQASPESVAKARRFISDRVSGPQADDVRLVVSEMVTNALVHSHGAVRLTSLRTENEISIEVWDNAAGATPTLRHPAPARPGGRGLQIIETICDTWGHRSDPPGKTVWGTIHLN